MIQPGTPRALVEVDPRTDARWDALQNDGGSLFTSAPWIGAVAEAYDLEPSARLLVDEAGGVLAGVAYCALDDIRGRRLVSFPFSDYHELLGRSAADLAELLGSFVGETPVRFRIPDRCVPGDAAGLGFTEHRDLLRHSIVVDRTIDDEQRFAALHTKVRQNIRKSQRAGITTEMSSGLDQLREFYELHVGVRTRKYRLLPQPFAFFEAIHRAFAPSGALTVALARHEGQAIAGIVYLELGDTLYYKFNASAAEELNVRPNEQLVWAGMERCVERGLSRIDLGISDIDQDGLVHYKRKLAQEESEVVTLTAAGSTPDPFAARAAEVGALLPQLTDLFTTTGVSAEVAERAGELLYRYFA